MHINENIVNKLTDEQKSKVEAARSPEELLAFAKEAGYELTLKVLHGKTVGRARKETRR